MSGLYIADSKISGKGAFTKHEFQKGDIVFALSGKIKRFKTHLGCNCEVCKYAIGIAPLKWKDPPEKSPAHFINHSCNPNCAIARGKHAIALHHIKKGDELTIDYSTTEIDKTWKIKCTCGSKNCRKTVRSYQFLPERLKQMYSKLIPEPFLKVA